MPRLPTVCRMDVSANLLVGLGAMLVLVAGCILAIVKPRVAWHLRHLPSLWAYGQPPEPSEAGLRFTRASGVLLLPLVLIVVAFLVATQLG